MKLPIRSLPALLLAFGMAACGSVEYRDTNAAVDANPLCVSRPDQPNETPSQDCVREQRASWNADRKREPVDFGGDDDDR